MLVSYWLGNHSHGSVTWQAQPPPRIGDVAGAATPTTHASTAAGERPSSCLHSIPPRPRRPPKLRRHLTGAPRRPCVLLLSPFILFLLSFFSQAAPSLHRYSDAAAKSPTAAMDNLEAPLPPPKVVPQLPPPDPAGTGSSLPRSAVKPPGDTQRRRAPELPLICVELLPLVYS